MGNYIIRMININLKNLKNIKYGNLQTKNYIKVKKNFTLEAGDILGIYGPNGSGKTAIVDACNLFKALVKGQSLSQDLVGLITQGEESCTLEFTFFIDSNGYKYLLFYEVEIEREEDDQGVFVSREKLSCSVLKEDKWKPKVTLIDYAYKGEECFKPAYRYNEIIGRDKVLPIKFEACRALARKKRTSFVFLEETKALFKACLGVDHSLITLVSPLVRFVRFNLYMITAESRGIIQLGELLTFDLFDRFKLPERAYESFMLHFKQTNYMLEVLIPGLQLEIGTHPNGELEFQAVKGDMRIPLRYESQGVKRMIMLIATIVPLYNYPNMSFVVDDLDEGIFEYIIGEFLEVVSEDMCGQLIFTGQNLRVLEKLSKACIRVTTANPTNKYISLENVKRNTNLRDFYLKCITLGGQKENLYEGVHKLELKAALKSATRMTQSIQ